MDFYTIKQNQRQNNITVYPSFTVSKSKDIMVRGKDFYAIWDQELGLWNTDEYVVPIIVDRDLREYAKRFDVLDGVTVSIKTLADYSSGMWDEYRQYISKVKNNYVTLDDRLTFLDDKVTREDYVSKRLPYSLEEGEAESWNLLISTLYDPDERAKIEWAIGSIIAGDSKNIQKFLVLYGDAGSGKSTILNVISKLFEGYTTFFEAKALGSSNNQFATDVFRDNPLVAIQHDGDLSKIEDNTKLNSIVSHEVMAMHEKYKSSYSSRANCFLFMATNRPVKITDAKSGIIRRLIDVHPSGRKLAPATYQAAMDRIDFELGKIAKRCLKVYREMGKNFYNNYVPFEMVLQTDMFYNFVEANYFTFKEQDSCLLKQAYSMYKEYCEESAVDYRLPMYKFREELKNYFREFSNVARVDGKQVRSYYEGFISTKFFTEEEVRKEEVEETPPSLVLDCTESIFDKEAAEYPAQYANRKGTPTKKWKDVESKLGELDTRKLHYVKLPENHIVIDFDLKGEDGKKSAERNLKEASKWPATYAEYSKSGKGIHLHYIYDGDAMALSRLYSEGIEVKVFTGDSSLRRQLTKCNNLPIATIKNGLPLKGVKMINFDSVKSEKGLRSLIERNLRKEIHPGTKPSIDFIYTILQQAYDGGLHYDVTDMRPKILAFANNSTNQAEYCLKLVAKMKFKSEDISEPGLEEETAPIVFFDIEVYPNLFLVNWKYAGDDKKVVRMINPSPKEIEFLFSFRLIGFNCRRYDNHVLYARYLGYDNEQLFDLSQKIINGSKNAFFGEAYNISYTDVYDFASAGNKKSLKKFEIELGIHHQEMGLPWDQPVPEEKWIEVAEYCDNDVLATEATFNYLKSDWIARQILADLSGLSVNDTTNQHSTKIIFGQNRKPQGEFFYQNLGEPVKEISPDMEKFLKERTTLPLRFEGSDSRKSILPYFPGYEFKNGKSHYRGYETGEGGFVYAEPGIYYDVALLDIASMHPSSIEDLYLFGPYTWVFSDVKNSRISFKHDDVELLNKLLDGRLTPFIERAHNGEFSLDDLSTAMKTVINSVYGLTSARFENPFKDPRNIDNIVAKRGALFMVDLLHAVQEKGFSVAHIKTDSIKIPNATPEIIEFVMEFGKKYGYTFEHEATYDRMCLVNDAVYIAKYDEHGIRTKGGKKANEWTATGAQFAQPYVFKSLFSKEAIQFEDMCETKSVTSAIYLDMNEELPEGEHDYQFVGKVGLFTPMKPGSGGGELVREKDGKYYAVTGTKGYRWLESEVVTEFGKENEIDQDYYINLVNEAVANISKYGDFEAFVSDDGIPPWEVADGPESVVA